MSKKWLYSVALGALLMAGETLGITVQDVLKIDWDNYRWNFDKLANTYSGMYRNKFMKDTHTTRADGTVENTFVHKASFNNGGINWKYTEFYDGIQGEDSFSYKAPSKLNINVKGYYRHKNTTNTQAESELLNGREVNYVTTTQENNIFKPRGKNSLPMGPYTMPEGLEDHLNNWWTSYEFYGTEHTATTNIVSDREAVITGVIRETGYIYTFDNYVVEEPASLLQKYTRYITTDDKYVYIAQDITQTMSNAGQFNYENAAHSESVVKFNKRGRWKSVTDEASTTIHGTATDWYKDYLKTNTTSVHNELAPTYGVRPGVAVDEHTQGMLDELNRSAGVRVVVRSTQEPADSITVNSYEGGSGQIRCLRKRRDEMPECADRYRKHLRLY